MTQSDARSFEHIFGTLILEESSVGADQPSLLAVGMSAVITSHKRLLSTNSGIAGSDYFGMANRPP